MSFFDSIPYTEKINDLDELIHTYTHENFYDWIEYKEHVVDEAGLTVNAVNYYFRMQLVKRMVETDFANVSMELVKDIFLVESECSRLFFGINLTAYIPLARALVLDEKMTFLAEFFQGASQSFDTLLGSKGAFNNRQEIKEVLREEIARRIPIETDPEKKHLYEWGLTYLKPVR